MKCYQRIKKNLIKSHKTIKKNLMIINRKCNNFQEIKEKIYRIRLCYIKSLKVFNKIINKQLNKEKNKNKQYKSIYHTLKRKIKNLNNK